jgi:DinB superfamily
VHTMGSAEDKLSVVCGTPVERYRPGEFAAAGLTAEALAERWRTLRERLDAALLALDDGALERPCRQDDEVMSGRELMLLAATHSAEHAGQAELTRDLLRNAAR